MYPSCHLLPLGVHIGRKLGMGLALGFHSRLACMDNGCASSLLTSVLNACSFKLLFYVCAYLTVQALSVEKTTFSMERAFYLSLKATVHSHVDVFIDFGFTDLSVLTTCA